MENAGKVNDTMANVKVSQISNAATEMVKLGVFSTDCSHSKKTNN